MARNCIFGLCRQVKPHNFIFTLTLYIVQTRASRTHARNSSELWDRYCVFVFVFVGICVFVCLCVRTRSASKLHVSSKELRCVCVIVLLKELRYVCVIVLLKEFHCVCVIVLSKELLATVFAELFGFFVFPPTFSTQCITYFLARSSFKPTPT